MVWWRMSRSGRREGWQPARSRRWLAARGAAGLLTGAALVALGCGVGIWHLANGGRGAVALLTVVALPVGLVVGARGTAALWQAAPRWWRPVPVVAVLAALLLVVLPGTLALAATHGPRAELGRRTPADVGLAYVEAAFRTRDGVHLAGWYVPSRDGAAVVLLHGAGSTRTDVLEHAAVLARHGLGVLLFDARGHGRSGGRPMELGWYGDADTSAAVGYLTRRPDVDPARIGAVGLSMGGEEALGAAAADPRIQAVVAEGATGRTRADRGWLPTHWRGQVQRVIDRVQFGLTDLLTPRSPPTSLRDAVRRTAPRPVLLIAAGSSPEGSEIAADTYIRAASPSSVRLWVVPGTTHTAGLRTHRRAWVQQVTGFLNAAVAAR